MARAQVSMDADATFAVPPLMGLNTRSSQAGWSGAENTVISVAAAPASARLNKREPPTRMDPSPARGDCSSTSPGDFPPVPPSVRQDQLLSDHRSALLSLQPGVPADDSRKPSPSTPSNGEFRDVVNVNGKQEQVSNPPANREDAPSSDSASISFQDAVSEAEFESEHSSESNDFLQREASTNERLLCTAFVSFLSFALLQLSFAAVAGSQAMVGDAAAMIVDALTYLFNWIAERRKNHLDSLVAGASNPARTKRKLELHMEIIPPIISVVTLVVVIVLVLRRSIHVLILDQHRSRDQQGNPNVGLMMIFSILNLFLDALNVYCFAQAKHLTAFSITPNDEPLDDPCLHRKVPTHRHRGNQSYCEVNGQTEEGDDETGIELSGHQDSQMRYHIADNGDCHPNANLRASASSPFSSSLGNHDLGDGVFRTYTSADNHSNLNMCSAFTHVFADTLRSIAVIVAALFAELLPGSITPEEADATAAVVVSVLILLSLLPLVTGLWNSLTELRFILADERSEEMLSIPR